VIDRDGSLKGARARGKKLSWRNVWKLADDFNLRIPEEAFSNVGKVPAEGVEVFDVDGFIR